MYGICFEALSAYDGVSPLQSNLLQGFCCHRTRYAASRDSRFDRRISFASYTHLSSAKNRSPHKIDLRERWMKRAPTLERIRPWLKGFASAVAEVRTLWLRPTPYIEPKAASSTARLSCNRGDPGLKTAPFRWTRRKSKAGRNFCGWQLIAPALRSHAQLAAENLFLRQNSARSRSQIAVTVWPSSAFRPCPSAKTIIRSSCNFARIEFMRTTGDRQQGQSESE
jgi:hypothetical protein